jgi:hypothetical protein
MPPLAHLRTSAVAIVAILAMLLVPACGSLCAAMNHCSTSTISPNSDSCHHTGMSADSDSAASSFTSPASCGQQVPPQAVLASSETSSQFKFVVAPLAPSSIEIPARSITLNGRPHKFPSAKESPQRIPLESLSILRI